MGGFVEEMGKYAHLVMGPAGSGKSTYCATIQKHCEALGRSVHIVNLDPATDDIQYVPSVDIRDLIGIEDVMEELQLGPNGGLVYCMEFLGDNFDWVREEIGGYEDDYILIDCPGQIELYTHLPVMKLFVKELQRMNYFVCSVYLLDPHFMSDSSKLISGALLCLTSMIQLELPHINVMSKMDLVETKGEEEEIERFLEMQLDNVIEEVNYHTPDRYAELNKAIGNLLEQFNMVSFVPLNIKEEDSISVLLQQIEHAIQYGDDEEPKEPRYSEEEE